MKNAEKKQPMISDSKNEIDLNLPLAKSIGFSFFIYFLVLFIQYSDIHDNLEIPGSTIYLKAPYLVLIVGVLLQTSQVISSRVFFNSLSYLAVPIFIIWVLNLNTDILIFGHQDKVSIYKLALKTYLIPVILLIIFITVKKTFFSNYENQQDNSLKTKLMLASIIIVPALYISTYFIIDERHPYMLNSLNFMIVVHSIVQSIYGKYVFFDQVSQYGGYAIILRPIWEIIDFNILNLSIVLAVLNLIVMLIIGFMTLKLVNSRLIGILGYLSFIYFHYFAFIVWPGEKYFQYDPLRTIFPALALFIFYYISHFGIKVFVLAFITGISVIWNIETGLCIFLTFILWAVTSLQIKIALKNIILFCLYFSGSIFLVISVVSFFALENFKVDFVFRMLNLYGVTAAMDDLAFGKPWVFVVLIFGISAALAQAIKTNRNKLNESDASNRIDRESTIIFLAILATCLISYHLLRLGQHDATLGNAAYLFPLLSAYIVDVLRKYRRNIEFQIKKFSTLYLYYLRIFIVVLLSSVLVVSSVSLFLIQNGSVVKSEERIWEFSKSSSAPLYDYVNDSGQNFWVTVADRANGQLSPYELRMRYVSKYAKSEIQNDILVLSGFDSMMYFYLNAKAPVSWANWYHAWIEDFEEVKKKIASKTIKKILVERYPGMNSEPFTFHPNEFDRYIDGKLKADFKLIDSEVVTKIWLEKGWSDVTLSMYELK